MHPDPLTPSMRRRRLWGFLIAALLVLPLVTWWFSRPPTVISFTGERPAGRFVPITEFEGKPWFDFKLPGGNRWTYPQKSKLEHRGIDHKVICGYWEPDVTDYANLDVRIFIDGLEYYVPISTREDPKVSPSASVKPVSIHRSFTSSPFVSSLVPAYPGRPMIALPYATDEKYSKATLEINGSSYEIKLPVKKEFGSAGRKPSVVKAGPYDVELVPKAWPISYAPLEFTATVTGSGSGEFDMTISTKTDTPGFTGNEMVMLSDVGVNSPFAVTLPRYASNELGITMAESTFKPIKLTVNRPAGKVQIATPDGTVIFGPGQTISRSPLSISLDGIPISNFPVAASAIEDKVKHVPNGGTITGRIKVEKLAYDLKVKLDVPPPIEPSAGAQSTGILRFNSFSSGRPRTFTLPPTFSRPGGSARVYTIP